MSGDNQYPLFLKDKYLSIDREKHNRDTLLAVFMPFVPLLEIRSCGRMFFLMHKPVCNSPV